MNYDYENQADSGDFNESSTVSTQKTKLINKKEECQFEGTLPEW